MRQIALIAHDIRSTHNVGSLLRTADGLGIDHVYLTGYTPYPLMKNDDRLPHIADKLTKSIHKTALGAETTTSWSHQPNINLLLGQLRKDGFRLVALEQSDSSISLADYNPPGKLALLLGREVEGIAPELLGQVDEIIEIPMMGAKESLNVVQAAAIALYQLRSAR